MSYPTQNQKIVIELTVCNHMYTSCYAMSSHCANILFDTVADYAKDILESVEGLVKMKRKLPVHQPDVPTLASTGEQLPREAVLACHQTRMALGGMPTNTGSSNGCESGSAAGDATITGPKSPSHSERGRGLGARSVRGVRGRGVGARGHGVCAHGLRGRCQSLKGRGVSGRRVRVESTGVGSEGVGPAVVEFEGVGVGPAEVRIAEAGPARVERCISARRPALIRALESEDEDEAWYGTRYNMDEDSDDESGRWGYTGGFYGGGTRMR